MDSKVRVLVVEDDDLSRRLLQQMLRGYNVTATQSARDAMSLLSRLETFDVIISDVMMPEMDGIEFMRSIKSCNIPVILVSSSTQFEGRSLEEGAVDFLNKPLKHGVVLNRVKNALSRHHSGPALPPFDPRPVFNIHQSPTFFMPMQTQTQNYYNQLALPSPPSDMRQPPSVDGPIFDIVEYVANSLEHVSQYITAVQGRNRMDYKTIRELTNKKIAMLLQVVNDPYATEDSTSDKITEVSENMQGMSIDGDSFASDAYSSDSQSHHSDRNHPSGDGSQNLNNQVYNNSNTYSDTTRAHPAPQHW